MKAYIGFESMTTLRSIVFTPNFLFVPLKLLGRCLIGSRRSTVNNFMVE